MFSNQSPSYAHAHVECEVSERTLARLSADSQFAQDLARDLPWYVVYTKVRKEYTACENLARQGHVVYLPRLKIRKRSRGCLQTRWEAMFPRYIFLQPGSANRAIGPIRSTLGVTTIVRFGLEPAVMSSEIIQGIRDLEVRRNAAVDGSPNPFRRGQRVSVADGPLKGLEGLISDVSQQRVIVLMQLLGQDTRVSLNSNQISVAN